MGRVEGKVVLISGAARGMGASHARLLANEGARVVLGDILDAEGEAVAQEIGDQARYVHLDVTVPGDWTAAVAVAVTEFGGLDVLVSNAGIIDFGSIEDYPLEAWNRVLTVNLTGTFLGLKAAIPAIKRSRAGSIVIVSSILGLVASPSLSAYVASKFALRGLAKAVALDVGKYGVRVNSVHPGLVKTPMTDGPDIPEDFGILRRAAQPSEISNLVLFLASDESSYSTGAEFVADAGSSSAGASFASDPP